MRSPAVVRRDLDEVGPGRGGTRRRRAGARYRHPRIAPAKPRTSSRQSNSNRVQGRLPGRDHLPGRLNRTRPHHPPLELSPERRPGTNCGTGSLRTVGLLYARVVIDPFVTDFLCNASMGNIFEIRAVRPIRIRPPARSPRLKEAERWMYARRSWSPPCPSAL